MTKEITPAVCADQLRKAVEQVRLWLGLRSPAHTIPAVDIALLATWAEVSIPPDYAADKNRARRAEAKEYAALQAECSGEPAPEPTP